MELGQMPRKVSINESSLTKMEIRKLNALRNSIGDDLGAKAFSQWYESRPAKTKAAPVDKTAQAIADAVMDLFAKGKIKTLPRGGYVIKRGRGRVVVELAG